MHGAGSRRGAGKRKVAGPAASRRPPRPFPAGAGPVGEAARPGRRHDAVELGEEGRAAGCHGPVLDGV